MLKNLKNIALVGVVVVGIILLLGFVNTLAAAIVPMTIVAVVAFILGRMSASVNFLSLILSRVRAKPDEQAAAAKAEKTEQVAAYASSMSQARTAEKLAEQPAPQTARLEAEGEESAELPAEVIKTEEQLRAESRRIEEEVARRTAGYDPKAAIEERKKRLLGKQD